MTSQNSLSWHIKRTFVLGLPIVASQILQMLIGVTDSLMVARLGELPLAQITLGTQVMFFFIISAVGFAIPIGPIVSTAVARDDERTTRRAVRMGIWQAIALCFVFVPIGVMSRPILEALGQEPEVVDGAAAYIDIAVWVLPFVFIGNALRNYLLSIERNRILMLISLAGVLVNFVGNYALIFGHFGMPKLGLVGSAWATLFTNGAMFFVTLWAVIREPYTRKVMLFHNPFRFDWGMFWRLIWLGLPTAAGLISEVGLFQAATLMMGWIGVSELAAYGLVLQIASLSFMIPLGFSIVASVRSGRALGRGDRHDLMMVAKSTFIVITCVMVITASIFTLLPHQLLSLVVDGSNPGNAELIALGVSYLAYAAAFQIFDGAQVSGMSIVRGLQDMLVPAILAFIAYWCLGMPFAYFLAFDRGWGGQGIWAGLVVALFFAAIFLWARFYQITRPEKFAARVAST